ncbi:MAG: sn-glycerol-3-phosphate ABC transporter ATP-binding protein UgpC [Bacilli bacterium]|nr:sn-glycerol-3-phosphate ABC transporter ATP-binding protein UgpC [Bacilli bacterium]
MSTVKFVNVNKIYDNNVQAVFDFNLEVADKEFIVLVGPSGCGKSTTLRMLAGLEDITSGDIIIDDVVVNDVLPKNRGIAMVFQNYALYPHMTVYDNMAFALKMKHLPKEEIDNRVREAAKVLALEEYLNRKPKALSGGQRQRVALGRAIVRTPKVFLMDEPLSNLDAKLRVQMRSEITRIHKKVNATTIYVTHDQTEAMTMADRIVIMKDGYIQQIGTPKEVYNCPSNMFVGGFIGSPAMNFLNCHFDNNKVYILGKDDDDSVEYNISDTQLTSLKKYKEIKESDLKEMLVKIDELSSQLQESLNNECIVVSSSENEEQKPITKKLNKNDRAKLEERINKLAALKERYGSELEELKEGRFDFVTGIRPEDITITKQGKQNKAFKVQAELSELLGHELIIYSDICGQRIIIKVSANVEMKSEDVFNISFNEDKVHFFDLDTQKRIDL